MSVASTHEDPIAVNTITSLVSGACRLVAATGGFAENEAASVGVAMLETPELDINAAGLEESVDVIRLSCDEGVSADPVNADAFSDSVLDVSVVIPFADASAA